MNQRYLLPVLAALALGAADLRAQDAASGAATRSLPFYQVPPPVLLPATASSWIGDAPPASDATLPERLRAALDKVYGAINARVRRGVQVSVIAPGLGQWNASAGYSDSATPITNAMRFQIGSISKTFTAAVILQLAQEGRLRLDDSIGTWIAPHANIDGSVTVRQLLNHSSGIYDFLNDDSTQTILVESYLTHPTRSWTNEEILALVGPPNFKAGTKTHYSNTGYILLGMIGEAITGHTMAREIRERLLDPKGLASTSCPWGEQMSGSFAHGWSIGFDPEGQVDISPIPTTAALSSARTAGGMASTAEDLARWANTLYNGDVLNSSMRDTMMAVKNTTEGEIGLGVFRWRYNTKLLYGHTGGILGYISWAFSIPRDSVSIGILINSFDPSTDVGSNAIGLALLAEIYRPVSGVAEAGPAGALAIEGAYPNPATDRARIRFSVGSPGAVRLDILDALGEHVATPVNATMEAGGHEVAVDLRGLPAGTYFCALHAGGATRIHAMQLAR